MKKKTLYTYSMLVTEYRRVYVDARSKKEAYDLVMAGQGDQDDSELGDPIKATIRRVEI